ncbi:formate dehydrogenase accessory protein FdhE [Anaerobacillus sp. HL2]|nr:formate dehydrogenase accessory protein FdhE [Anaerobacillus sp. HL2]
MKQNGIASDLVAHIVGMKIMKKLNLLNVENDTSAKIEVCEKCNSYIKLIDTRKLFKKQTAFILDVTSLHLDFIAQESTGIVMTKKLKVN